MEHELQNLVLGALLHDIGKFKQRAAIEEDQGGTHVAIGHRWLVSHYGEGFIASGARNHHGNEPETWARSLAGTQKSPRHSADANEYPSVPTNRNRNAMDTHAHAQRRSNLTAGAYKEGNP